MSTASMPDNSVPSRSAISRSRQRTVSDARQRLTSSSGTKSSYDFELLNEYANTRVSSMWAMPVLLAALAMLAAVWVPPIGVGIWACSVVLSHFLVMVFCLQFSNDSHREFEVKSRTRTFILVETLYGLCWATLAAFPFLVPGQDTLVIQWAILMVGIGANAMFSRAIPGATLANSLPPVLAVSATLVISGGSLSYALAVFAIGGGVFFNYLSRALHRSALKSIEHRAEKDVLIYELEEATLMSDEARRQAEQANIAKSRFLATMSHELRTPLNAIIGFSEVMKSELLGPMQNEQYKDYSSDIHASGEHLLNLINELLDLSRIEAGKYDLNEEAVSLVDIGEDCRRMLEIRSRAKSIELEAEFDGDLPKLWGDERAIRQICLNLLSNAIKFTPEGGKIIFRIAEGDGGTQIMSVRDNGPGIPEDEIATVLSSFGQGSLAAKTAEQGAGLGLPIVQKIMELHQGRFDLFSKLRFGTEAIATFPKSRVMNAMAPVKKRRKLEIYAKGNA